MCEWILPLKGWLFFISKPLELLGFPKSDYKISTFIGTVAWNFWPFLPVWIQFPSILNNYSKFWSISGQIFSEILRISEKDWPLNLRFDEKVYLYYKLLGDTLMLLKNILGEPRTRLPILVGDSMSLREGFPPRQRFSENR